MGDSPFDPPKPEDPAVLEIAGAIAATFGVLALDVATGGILSGLNSIPGECAAVSPGHQPFLDSLADTAAPEVDSHGNVACSRCSVRVTYSTMSLNEHGYFCEACATALS